MTKSQGPEECFYTDNLLLDVAEYHLKNYGDQGDC